MAKKKSRKVGQIGVPKSSVPRRSKKPQAPERSKSTKGNKSGTRQQEASKQQTNKVKEQKDPRLGSKKPVNLAKYKGGDTVVDKIDKLSDKPRKYKTPQEELDAIENNQELERLLEKQSTSQLSNSEQAFVDKLTERYHELCEMLGIDTNDLDDDEHENLTEDDPFAKLDAIKLDDYKD